MPEPRHAPPAMSAPLRVLFVRDVVFSMPAATMMRKDRQTSPTMFRAPRATQRRYCRYDAVNASAATKSDDVAYAAPFRQFASKDAKQPQPRLNASVFARRQRAVAYGRATAAVFARLQMNFRDV